MTGIGQISLHGRHTLCFDRQIGHRDFARLPVEFKEYGPGSVDMGITDRQKLDDQRLARLNVDRNFLAGFQAVEEIRSGENTEI